MEVSAITAPDTLIGTTLLGRYHILDRIGAGAMGAVYSAQQIGLDRPVALKVLKRHRGTSGDVIARFEREAKAMSALVHPNTVRVYDFGVASDGMMFLAMELLHGELATSRLKDGQAVSTVDAIVWTQQVLRSVGEAHQKGIIHRDIKPDNIFLARAEGEKEPIAKVLDFGIAKAIEGDQKLDQFETLDGTVFGTPRYMSPEQAQGKPLDHRSDLYAVGIVLYEFLVGAPPFVDRDAVVVMAKHIRDQPAPLKQAAWERTFPANLQRVLDKALDKSAAMRFQSAEEFERALDGCLREAEWLEHVPLRGRKLVGRALSLPHWARWSAGAALLGALATGALALRSGAGDAETDEPAIAAAAAAAASAAKAPAPALAAPVTHSVALLSTPSGANVWSQGRFVGVTPLPLDVAAGQSLRVRVSLAGYTSQTLDLSASEDQRVIELERAPSNAAVVSAEERARPPRRARPTPNAGASTASPRPPAKSSDAPADAYEKF
jgi:serine/threonine-protein kinase